MRIAFVITLGVAGLLLIAVEATLHIVAAIEKVALLPHSHVLVWTGVALLTSSVALAGWGDEIAAGLTPLAELLRKFVPWGRKDPP
jgi:hypothetical protein